MIDKDKIRLSKTRKVEIQEIMQILGAIEQRNSYIKSIGFPGAEDSVLHMIDYCNKQIEKILNLKTEENK